MRLFLRAVVLLFALTHVPVAGKAQTQSGTPYNVQQIVTLLEGGWAGPDIIGMVREDCISFRVAGQAEAALKKAGADDPLLSGLRSVCYRSQPRSGRGGNTGATGGTRVPQPRGIVLIEGELPAGWFRTVNDLPMSTNRKIDLTPGRTATIVVAAPGWCPARTEVTLKPGEENRWTPALRGRPWVGDC